MAMPRYNKTVAYRTATKCSAAWQPVVLCNVLTTTIIKHNISALA